MKKLLVLLQNAWGVDDGYIPSLNKKSFISSHTGKRLREALPDDCKVKIRNSSPHVGSVSSSNFPPDLDYVRSEIRKIKPDVILACGVNARIAVENVEVTVPVVFMPHPAYRQLSKQMTLDTKNDVMELLTKE